MIVNWILSPLKHYQDVDFNLKAGLKIQKRPKSFFVIQYGDHVNVLKKYNKNRM